MRQTLARPPDLGLLLAAAVTGAIYFSLVGLNVLAHPARAAVGLNPASDYQVMTWSLRWWPFAVGHGLNPLHTNLLWPPKGVSTLWMTTIPALSLLGLPLTLTAGPLVSYNVLMLLAPMLAAAAGYLLCRELTARRAPALVGGLLFALSPYMLGHLLSQHLDLIFVFPLPLLALLIVRRRRDLISGRRFVVLFAALLLLLLGCSFELFLDTALLAALGVCFALLAPTHRRAALELGSLIGLAYALCLPLLIPIAVLALGGPHAPLQYSPGDYSIDLLNIVVPTATLLAGNTHAARALTAHFVGNVGEKDGYVGIPLLLIALRAVRAEWRRGAWLIGALSLAALALSLGPTLTVGGRPAFGLPFAAAHLPVLSNALPARLTVFSALGLACLCALWLARPGFAPARLLVAAVLLLGTLPNFVASHQLEGAWARSQTFGWSTRKVSLGLITVPRWSQLVPPHSTVLVLPAGTETASGYWQAATDMSFAIAAPATPFVPERVAAAPIVRAIAAGALPSLVVPRLRAFLLSDRISSVFVAPNTGSRWRAAVAKATAAAPVSVRAGELYRVRHSLRPLRARGRYAVVFAPRSERVHGCNRGRVRAALAWLRFDGQRAHLQAELLAAGHPTPVVSLSSRSGDADMPALSIGRCGEVAVIFTEWRRGVVKLRVATFDGRRWAVATLDRRTQPIWSPRVAITAAGTSLATWVDDDAPQRTVRASARLPGAPWERAVTLERSDGLGSGAVLSARRLSALLAWHDQSASESRIRVARYARGRWGPVVTLASDLSTLDDIAVGGRASTLVRWNLEPTSEQGATRFEARLQGSRWRPAREVD
ncbi:MAG TPA: hypothetical protein VF002_07555 [Gaiellaceae bacterium]